MSKESDKRAQDRLDRIARDVRERQRERSNDNRKGWGK